MVALGGVDTTTPASPATIRDPVTLATLRQIAKGTGDPEAALIRRALRIGAAAILANRELLLSA